MSRDLTRFVKFSPTSHHKKCPWARLNISDYFDLECADTPDHVILTVNRLRNAARYFDPKRTYSHERATPTIIRTTRLT